MGNLAGRFGNVRRADRDTPASNSYSLSRTEYPDSSYQQDGSRNELHPWPDPGASSQQQGSRNEGSDQVENVLHTVDDSPLGEDDHFDILTEMMPVASSWKAIGRGLRIDSGRLDMIHERNPGKPRDCLSEVITCWLKRNYNVERFGEPTWKAVVKVVAHPAVGDNCALAMSIVKKHLVVSAAAPHITVQTPLINQVDSYASKSTDYLHTSKGASVSPRPSSSTQSEDTQKPLSTGSPTPTFTTRSFPYLEESGLTPEQQERLSTRLRVESEDIVRKFWRLHSRVYESLRQRNIPVDRLVVHLLSLGAFDPVMKDSQKPVLQTFSQEFRNAGSIEDVLFAIKDYFSFFNYHVIEHIVDELGTNQDKFELQNYKKEFAEYSKRRIYECLPVYGSVSKDGHIDLVLKVDLVYEKFTVNELKNFEYRLSRIFCVSPQTVLRLCRVEEGCLQLIFQVPSFLLWEIFPLSGEQERALAAERVIRLTCGHYQFTGKRDENESEQKGTELRVPVFQSALKIDDIDADSARGTGSIADDTSSCWFSDNDEDPLSKELQELDEEFKVTLQISSGHQITENTPELHLAAMRGDMETVSFLIAKEHQNPLQKDEYGDTALHAAAQGGRLNVLKYFIDERNCNPVCLGYCGRTPLHVATEHAHLDVIKYLVTDQQVEPLCQDDDKLTPLHLSCQSGCLGIVKFLTGEIEKYKPINDILPYLTAKNTNNPLHIAALSGHTDIVRFLITDLKCSPNMSGFLGRTLLHSAAQEGHLNIMMYVINEHGCDPSCLDKDKVTPLHLAAGKGHSDIVKFLTLEKHCKSTCRNSSGTTPIHWAAKYGHLEILKFFIDELKCTPVISGEYGRTPLHSAAGQGHLHIIKYLTDEQGCDPSCLDRNKQTPLHRAAHNGHLHVVKLLTLEKCCNPRQKDILKSTPLHYAAVNGHLQVVQFLVEKVKCAPNMRGVRNATAHQLAETMGHLNVALYLQKFRHSTQ